MKVMIVKELMTGDVSPVAMFRICFVVDVLSYFQVISESTYFLQTLLFLLQMTFVWLVIFCFCLFGCLTVCLLCVLIYFQVETYFLPSDLVFLASDDICLVGCFLFLFVWLFVCLLVVCSHIFSG